jgi:Na+-translocating ferredoxin:NAD+ oxidoreductase RnfG subunit
MCGINKDGKIVGADYIASNETLSAEVGLGDRFVNKGEDEMTPDIVAGSTAKLTTGAYYNAILDAFKAFTVFNGGTVDIRTPEQILQDNCNAALGTTAITFTRWFATEVLTGVKAVYVAPQDAGFVYAVGEHFVGVNADGEIVTANTDATVAETVTAAHALLSASKTTEITELPAGIHKSVTKIQKTESGNYVFEVNAESFSQHMYDEYGSGNDKPIVIRISISKDGKIIDCLTLSHEESKGYGDKCATEAYRDTWNGITVDGVSGNGIITGATYTTEGYQKGVKRAFEAFAILTGGADNE